MVLYICLRFHENISIFNLQSGHEDMVELAMLSVQREIIPKVGRIMVHVFCMPSHGPYHLCSFMKISQKVSVMERT